MSYKKLGKTHPAPIAPANLWRLTPKMKARHARGVKLSRGEKETLRAHGYKVVDKPNALSV